MQKNNTITGRSSIAQHLRTALAVLHSFIPIFVDTIHRGLNLCNVLGTYLYF